MTLPTDAAQRKATPITTGVLDYFPDALAAVAAVSKAGNDQHNPGEPLHWSKDKSNDHADCLVRHLLERGTLDSDGQLHSAKVAWRALALLQIELEAQDGHGSETTPREGAGVDAKEVVPYPFGYDAGREARSKDRTKDSDVNRTSGVSSGGAFQGMRPRAH